MEEVSLNLVVNNMDIVLVLFVIMGFGIRELLDGDSLIVPIEEFGDRLGDGISVGRDIFKF